MCLALECCVASSADRVARVCSPLPSSTGCLSSSIEGGTFHHCWRGHDSDTASPVLQHSKRPVLVADKIVVCEHSKDSKQWHYENCTNFFC